MIICAALLLLINAGGCKENEKFYYDGDSSALNIWLGQENVVSDSIVYNFAYQKDFDSLMFYVRLTGLPVDRDRAFTLEAVEGDIYAEQEYVLKSGEYKASFPLYFTKPEGPEFKEQSGRVIFKMRENEYFKEGARETSQLYIILKNSVGKPENWDAATYPYRTLATYFGTYSDAKYSFIIQTTGKSNFKVYYTTSPSTQLAADEITSIEAAFLQSQCKIALLEYNALHGDLLDENNEKVIFP
jgi:hypothetical protein